MEEIKPDTWDRMIKARVYLLKKHPFFGELGSYIRPKPCEHIPTAAITQKGEFLINPEFANKANVKDFVFILAHETMHIVAGYFNRKPFGADEVLWQYTGDIAINYLIVKAGIELPREELIVPLYKGFDKYFGKTHEEIYYDMQKDSKKNKESCQGKWVDTSACGCEELFKDMQELQKIQWSQRIIAAASSGRQAGNLPGDLEEFIANLNKPKQDWRRLLRLSVQNCIRKSFTWKKPNRRTLSVGITTPGKIFEIPSVCVYIDTSGSISDIEINEALSEMTGILAVTGGKGILLLGDSVIYYYGEVTKESLKKLPVQRGGTDFRVVFEKIKEENIKPKAFVGFSDLCGPFPDDTPNYPVMWVRPSAYRDVIPPFGRTIDANFKNKN